MRISTAVARELASDNRDVLANRLTLDAFTAKWVSRVRASPPFNGRTDVHAVGMVLSSQARHRIAAGLAAADVPADIERRVLAATTAPDPPRDNLALYLLGPGYLDEPAETLFKINTLRVGNEYARAVELLSPLLDPAGWDSPAADAALTRASEHFQLAADVHRRQSAAPREIREAFRNRVRGFFRPLTLGGRTFEGINAAHERHAIVADFVLGTATPAYADYVDEIAPHLSIEDQQWLFRRRADGTLIDSLRTWLRSDRVAARRPATRHSKTALVADVLLSHATVSSAHVGVIERVLAPREPAVAGSVTPPTHGTGGRSHEVTLQWTAMRKETRRAFMREFGIASTAVRDAGGAH